MSATAIEGYVENGQIKLPDNTKLPEKARVYVVIPEAPQVFEVKLPRGDIHIRSPRLADTAKAAFFRKTMEKQ